MSNSDARLTRMFGQDAKRIHPAEMRGIAGMTPALKSMIRGMILEYEGKLAAMTERLDDQAEIRDRLTFLQCALIALLEQQGGSVTLYAGQLGEIPKGSVIKIDKLAMGEGDRVPLRVSWRPPDPDRPATTDLRPGS